MTSRQHDLASQGRSSSTASPPVYLASYRYTQWGQLRPVLHAAGPKGKSLNPLRQVLDFVDEEVPCVSYEQVRFCAISSAVLRL